MKNGAIKKDLLILLRSCGRSFYLFCLKQTEVGGVSVLACIFFDPPLMNQL